MEKEILGQFSMEEVTDLVIDGYRGVSSKEEFTAEERKVGANKILVDLAQDYRNNKNQIFAIIEKSIDVLLPQRLEEGIGRIADVETFALGDTPKFTVRNGRIKAYTVASGGGVQRHRLSKKSITIETEMTQVKVYEEFDRVQAGLVDFNELIEEALDELEKEFYNRIYTTLVETYAVLPKANKHQDTKVQEKELDKLIRVVKSYGKPVILGTSLALAEIPKIEGLQADQDMYENGYVQFYKGVPVIEMENAVEDETNESFILEDRYLYIIPEGKEKIVKVAIEGQARVREVDGKDWTTNFETAVKNGTAVLQTNHFAIYDNSSLANE